MAGPQQTVATAHKDAAVSFLRLAASGRVRDAYAKHVDVAAFRHHNPYFEGTAAALMAGMEEAHRETPNQAFEVKHAIAEGDLVAVHSKVVQPAQTIAVVHLFRFQGDRIVELWDVAVPMPESSPNRGGMF